MEAHRRTFDDLAFALALTAISAAGVGFASSRNGAAVIMCGICFAGLVGARIVGLSGLSLLPVALGLVAILWLVWIDPPASSRQTSALAHGAGGLLVGWMLAINLRRRVAPPWWVLAALVLVAALTVAWEFGEYLGDRALDTGLIPSKRDSALDVFLGTLGGALAIFGVALVPRRERAG